ncbi:MAG: cyanophycin synthetase, partial [Candidatus Nitrotoga sp.]
MDYLGDTREKIAFEKAGILRAGKVAVFGDMDVPDAVRAVAKNVGAQLQCLGEHFSFTAGGQQWNFKGVANSNNQNADAQHAGTRSALPYPTLRGAFQLNNASAALAALDAIKDQLPVSMDAVRRGLVEITLPGRFQVIPGRPMFILDVAHNPHAARALAQNLADMSQHEVSKRGNTFAIFSMLKDKDQVGVVRALAKKIDVWLVAGIDAVRGATSAEMAAMLQGEGISALSFVTIAEAVQSACNQAGENDRIVAFGSFYTVAEVMRARGLRDK